MITEFPLFVFTTLVGIAAGAYVFAAIFPNDEAPKRPWVFPLVALVLVGVGSLASVTHVGRPQLIFGILANPTASLTLEAAFAGVLALVAFVDCVFAFVKKHESRAIRAVGAVAGLAAVCVITYAYATSYGNPAWTAAPTLPLLLLGGLAAGAGLWALFSTDAMRDTRFAVTSGAAAVLFAVVLAWQASVYAGLGESVATLVAGAILAAVAGVLAFVAPRVKFGGAGAVCLVLAVLALCVSRYGFYLASII